MSGEIFLMLKTITIEIDGIGSILFEHSKRAKHLNISVKPFTKVRVAVPYRVSFTKAKEIIYSKIDWIQKHLRKMERIEREHKSILENFIDIDRVKAKILLIDRLNKLAKKHGFTYNKVSIRNQKARWGSCSAKNNISLNMKLVRLPEELIDYVILHELVHLKIKNHSKDFWVELNKFVKDVKIINAKLKKYNLGFL